MNGKAAQSRREHAPETVWKAQDLYCLDRLSFMDTAKALGIADSTVRRWAKQYGWREKREELARIESERRINFIKARADMLQRLLGAEKAGDAAQAAFGVASLENLEIKKQEALAKAEKEALKERGAPLVTQNEKTAPEETFTLPDGISDDERLALLESAVNSQIALLLNRPVPDISRHMKEIKDALDLVAKLKGKDASRDSGIRVGFESDD